METKFKDFDIIYAYDLCDCVEFKVLSVIERKGHIYYQLFDINQREEIELSEEELSEFKVYKQ